MTKKFSKNFFCGGVVDWGRRLDFGFCPNKHEQVSGMSCTEELVCTGVSLVLTTEKETDAKMLATHTWNYLVQNASVSANVLTYAKIIGGEPRGNVLHLTSQFWHLMDPFVCNSKVTIPLPFQFQGDSAWTLDSEKYHNVAVELTHKSLCNIVNAYVKVDFEIRKLLLRRIVMPLEPEHVTLAKLNPSTVFVNVAHKPMHEKTCLRYIYFVPIQENYGAYSTVVCQEKLQVTVELCQNNLTEIKKMECSVEAWESALSENADSQHLAARLASQHAFVWQPHSVTDESYFRHESAKIQIVIGYEGKNCDGDSLHLIVEPVLVYDVVEEQKNVPTVETLETRLQTLEKIVLAKK